MGTNFHMSGQEINETKEATPTTSRSEHTQGPDDYQDEVGVDRQGGEFKNQASDSSIMTIVILITAALLLIAICCLIYWATGNKRKDNASIEETIKATEERFKTNSNISQGTTNDPTQWFATCGTKKADVTLVHVTDPLQRGQTCQLGEPADLSSYKHKDIGGHLTFHHLVHENGDSTVFRTSLQKEETEGNVVDLVQEVVISQKKELSNGDHIFVNSTLVPLSKNVCRVEHTVIDSQKSAVRSPRYSYLKPTAAGNNSWEPITDVAALKSAEAEGQTYDQERKSHETDYAPIIAAKSEKVRTDVSLTPNTFKPVNTYGKSWIFVWRNKV